MEPCQKRVRTEKTLPTSIRKRRQIGPKDLSFFSTTKLKNREAKGNLECNWKQLAPESDRKKVFLLSMVRMVVTDGCGHSVRNEHGAIIQA
eukprot:327945-Pelagomonas_calceolata.AAC.1